MISQTHWSDIGSTLLKYKEDGFMCDTILMASDGELKAHGVILAAICPPCKRAFENDPQSGIHRLDFPDIDIGTLEVILHFAYTGKLVLPLKESQKDEVSQMFATLQSLEIDIRRFNGSEIKFTGGGGDNNGIQNAVVKPCHSGASSDTGEQESDVKQETIFISVSDAQDSDAVGRMERVKSEGEWIIEPGAKQYVTSTEGEQQIVLECSSEIDAQQFELIQNILSSGVADGVVENGVVSEHSYYSYDTEQQKPGEFGGVTVKIERKNDEESDSEEEIVSSDENGGGSAALLTCPICSEVFESAETLQSHVSSNHDDVSIFKCDKCLRKFSSVHSLAKHANLNDGCKPFLCEVCGESFVQRRSMKEHMGSHHNTEFIYLCPFCQLTFASQNKLRVHCAISHKMSGKEFDDSDVQPIQVFNSENCGLVVSQESDDVTRPYLCDVCGRNFKTSWSLKNHEKIHSGISSMQMYSCPLCSKTFAHKSQVLQHMVSHSGTKPHTCHVCSKSYSQKGSLTQHMRTHSGERPYACVTCGKTFIIKAMLMQHVRVHTGEKPHICSVCGKAFIYKESLVVHLRIHTGEKPYKCSVCNNSYTQSHHLKGHMLTHTGEKPFTCSFCEKAYKNRVDLRFHCQRVHQVNISKRPTKTMKAKTIVAVV